MRACARGVVGLWLLWNLIQLQGPKIRGLQPSPRTPSEHPVKMTAAPGRKSLMSCIRKPPSEPDRPCQAPVRGEAGDPALCDVGRSPPPVDRGRLGAGAANGRRGGRKVCYVPMLRRDPATSNEDELAQFLTTLRRRSSIGNLSLRRWRARGPPVKGGDLNRKIERKQDDL